MTAKLPSTVGLIEQTGFCGMACRRLQRSPRRYNSQPDLERQPFTTASEGSQ